VTGGVEGRRWRTDHFRASRHSVASPALGIVAAPPSALFARVRFWIIESRSAAWNIFSNLQAHQQIDDVSLSIDALRGKSGYTPSSEKHSLAIKPRAGMAVVHFPSTCPSMVACRTRVRDTRARPPSRPNTSSSSVPPTCASVWLLCRLLMSVDSPAQVHLGMPPGPGHGCNSMRTDGWSMWLSRMLVRRQPARRWARRAWCSLKRACHRVISLVGSDLLRRRR